MPLPVAVAAVVSTAVTYGFARVLVKLVAALGLGVVSYVGFDLLFDSINDYLLAILSDTPATVVQILEICNVPEAIGIIFSAYISKFTVGAVLRRLTVGN